MNDTSNNDVPRIIVAGNGFEPSVDDLQGLLTVGHIKPGMRLDPVQGDPWSSREDAKQVGKALLDAAVSSSGSTGNTRMRLRDYQEREFLIIMIGTAEEKKRAVRGKRRKRSKRVLLVTSALVILGLAYAAVFYVPERVFFPPGELTIEESIHALGSQTVDRRLFDGDENGRFDFLKDQTIRERMIFRNETVENKKAVPYSDLSRCVPAVEKLLSAGPEAVGPLVDNLKNSTVVVGLPEGLAEHQVPIRISKFQNGYEAPSGDPLRDPLENCISVTLGVTQQSDWIELTLSLMGEPAVEPLRKIRWHETQRLHWSVVRILEHLGEEPTQDPVPEKALPVLFTFLKSKFPEKRDYATTMLQSVGSEGIDEFKKHRWDEDPRIQQFCLKQLRRLNFDPDAIGTVNSEAIPGLFELLRGNNEQARNDAKKALQHVGPDAVPVITTYLKGNANSGLGLRRTAYGILERLGPQAQAAVPTLTAILMDGGEVSNYSHAMKALFHIRPPAQEVMPVLWKIAKSDRKGEQNDFATKLLAHYISESETFPAPESLQALGLESTDQLLELAILLNVKSPNEAAALFSNIGDPVIPALIGELKHEDGLRRDRAVVGLGLVGKATPEVLSALNSVLAEEEDQSIRQKAINVLVSLGKESEDAYSALFAKLGSGTDARYIQQALKETQPPVHLLGDALSSPVVEARLFAINKLLELGPAAGEAIPALQQATADSNDRVASTAVDVLKNIGLDTEGVIDALFVTLSVGTRKASQKATALLKSLGEDVVPHAAEQLKHPKSIAQIKSLKLLASLKEESAAAIPAVVVCLADEDWKVRIETVRTLHQLGPKAVSTLPKLKIAQRRAVTAKNIENKEKDRQEFLKDIETLIYKLEQEKKASRQKRKPTRKRKSPRDRKK